MNPLVSAANLVSYAFNRNDMFGNSMGAGGAVMAGIGLIPSGLFKCGAKGGVYMFNVVGKGTYIGQSNNVFSRMWQHVNIHLIYGKGKFFGSKIEGKQYWLMPGSTKLEREVFEQYQIFKYKFDYKLLNDVNPMGGRMNLYNEMIEDVLTKYNLQ